MNTKKKIDPSHIWDIRDERLDTTSKALLVRLAGLQHLGAIWVSNGTLAQELVVSKRTIIEKVKMLVEAGYISERDDVNEATQTKFTQLNGKHIIEQILACAKGARKGDLERYYCAGRGNNKKRPLPTLKSEMAQTEIDMKKAFAEMERDILLS